MEQPPKSESKPGNAIPCLILAVLVLAAYAGALRNGFTILDDPQYVTDNSIVKQGLTWPGLIWAFHSNVGGNWHPLTMLSHMLDCGIFGLQAWGHHLTNVLLHAANTVLLFVLLRRMTGAFGRSFFVALLFGLHPLHVESVAWVAERKDVLSTFFALWTLLMYVNFTQEKRRRNYWLALVCFACGLMSKPMLVTLPCTMLLLDFWPLGRLERQASLRLLVEKIPFFSLAVAVSFLTLATQKVSAAMPFSLRVENALVACMHYLGKIFWPVDLCAFYPLPDLWPLPAILISALVLAAVSAVAIWRVRQESYLFTGWFWFVGILVPVIGLVQVGMQSMADRYTYLPAVGIFLAVAWLAVEVADWLKWSKAVLPAVASVVTAICAGLTWQQTGYWRDPETLLNRVIAVAPDEGLKHFFLATQYNVLGRKDDAIREMRECVRMENGSPEMHEVLAAQLEAAGSKDEAIKEYAEAMRLAPHSVEAGNGLGMALNRLGRYDAAVQVYQVALESNPEVETLHLNLGNALAHTGKLAEAVEQFRAALALKPDDVDAHNNLGVMLFQMKQLEAAAAEFQAVLKLDPQNAEAQRNLNTIAQMKSRMN